MNKDKLESLRRIAADERTPVEEARNAALLFVRGGGRTEDVATRDELAAMTLERDAARQDIAALRLEKQARDALLERIGQEKREAENEATRLRSILTRLMDARKAEILAEKVRARAEQEAREAIGFDGEGKKTPPEKLRYEIDEEFAREYAARVSEWHAPPSRVHPKK